MCYTNKILLQIIASNKSMKIISKFSITVYVFMFVLNSQDPSRLHYNNSELQQFEDIECEWPLSICFLMLDAMFSHDDAMAEHYWSILQDVGTLFFQYHFDMCGIIPYCQQIMVQNRSLYSFVYLLTDSSSRLIQTIFAIWSWSITTYKKVSFTKSNTSWFKCLRRSLK